MKSINGEWNDAILQCWATSGTERVLFASFTGKDSTNFHLVSGGIDYLKFWTIDGPNLIPSKGVFGSVGKVQPMLCGTWIGNRFVTGSSSGHLYVWHDCKLEKIIKAHKESIDVIHTSRGKKWLVTRSTDGCIAMFSSNFEQSHTYDMSTATVEPIDRRVRSISTWLNSLQTDVNKVLVRTKGSEIYEISVTTGNMILLHEAHCRDECWGLAMHPNDPNMFATCGEDQTVFICSVGLQRVIRKVKTGCSVRSIAWSNDGDEILVGCGDGNRGMIGREDGVVSIFTFPFEQNMMCNLLVVRFFIYNCVLF